VVDFGISIHFPLLYIERFQANAPHMTLLISQQQHGPWMQKLGIKASKPKHMDLWDSVGAFKECRDQPKL
jgi:hypothetical protein